VDLGRAEAVLPLKEQVPRENYRPNDRVRAYVIEVNKNTKGSQIILSRTCIEMLTKLFEQEVPEIYEGIVTIQAAAREPGGRSKIAVASRDSDVDPVGACVGMKGSRVQSVVQELRGERIDIVPWSPDPARYVCSALSPAAVSKVIIDDAEKSMDVIVPDDQLSLAIGRKGQNVRLASKLVGWNLDIKSEIEKKAEVEAEMEGMRMASEELSMLPSIDATVSTILLDVGFRTVEEVSLASMDDLTAIDGVDEELSIAIHDAAETMVPVIAELREQQAQEAAEQAAIEEAEAAAEAAEAERLAAEMAAAVEAEEPEAEEDADSELAGQAAEETAETTSEDPEPQAAEIAEEAEQQPVLQSAGAGTVEEKGDEAGEPETAESPAERPTGEDPEQAKNETL